MRRMRSLQSGCCTSSDGPWRDAHRPLHERARPLRPLRAVLVDHDRGEADAFAVEREQAQPALPVRGPRGARTRVRAGSRRGGRGSLRPADGPRRRSRSTRPPPPSRGRTCPGSSRPAGHAGEVVHQRLVAELDRPGAQAALLVHAQAEPLAGRHHHVLVESVEARRHPGQDAPRHLRPEGIAVELLAGGDAHALARGARLVQRGPAPGAPTPPARGRRRSIALLQGRPARGSSAASGSRNRPTSS